MDIAIDVRSLMEGSHSGVAEYTSQIVRAFTRVAPHHHYLLFYNSYSPIALPDFGPSTTTHWSSYPNKILSGVQYISSWPKWDSLVSADVFFVPNLQLLPLSGRTPMVVTAHDLAFERFPWFYSWRRRAWHMLMRPRTLMAEADQIIAVSEATAADVVRLYDIPADKVKVVHSGIFAPAEKISDLAKARVRKKYALPERYVLFLGTQEPRKNIPSIIQAYSAIADIVPHHLVIAGRKGWLTKEVEHAVALSDQSSRIHRIGSVDPADKYALYAAADLFVYPSFYEGFGFPPLEALLAGVTVITSHNSALPEIVGAWAHLVDPYNPGELGLLIRELLLQPIPVSDDVRTTIRNEYSWDTAARRTLEIIESVC